ncbi:MAG TPA: hypothetical protein VFK24_10365 [Gammaproteobacteria bacterium]|nr:hypothetical protein [Gammaproteobacteria bacterium]
MMSPKDLFDRVGSPLLNVRRSWGSIRPIDGAVFLRVWQDECHKIDGQYFVRITANRYFLEQDPTNFGYQERLDHVEKIKAGSQAYLVMCRAKDPKAHPRAIAGINDRELFKGGAIREIDGDIWIALENRIPVGEVRAN